MRNLSNKEICKNCSKLEKMLFERGFTALVFYYDYEESFQLANTFQNSMQFNQKLWENFKECKNILGLY